MSEPSLPGSETPAQPAVCDQAVPGLTAARRVGPLATRRSVGTLEIRVATTGEFLPPVRPWVHGAGLVLLGSFAAGVMLMAVWPYRVIVRGMGVVRPSGETSVIHAPFAGRVRQLLVPSNARVQAGQVLALLDPTDLRGKQQQISQNRQALGQQARALVNQGLAALQAAELEVEKSQAALRFAETELRRFQQLAGTGAITATQLEEKAASYNVARANLAKARQAVAEQRARSISDQAQLERELAGNRAEAGQIRRDLDKSAIRAPVPGVLFSLALRNPGQMVAAGEEIVPSQDVTSVEVGQRADLRIQGCPYPDFGTLPATVRSIAPEASQPPVPGKDSGGSPQPPILGVGYEVTLAPHRAVLVAGKRRCELRQGMDLQADITTRAETVLSFLLRKARLSSGL
jgi:multidrug efflux pump subunit AcrA (membrane-fusion protein)